MSRSILEVWDYRLSTAEPLNYRGTAGVPGVPASENWVACVYAQDDRDAPLECHDTGVPKANEAGLDACFAFYRSVRDKYSRPDIEALKPSVAAIREKQAEVINMGGQ